MNVVMYGAWVVALSLVPALSSGEPLEQRDAELYHTLEQKKAGGTQPLERSTLEERVEELEKRNAELYHTLQQKKAGGVGSQISERISLSGLVEVEMGYQRLTLRGEAEDESSSDMVLATAQLGVTGQVTESVAARILLLYEDGDSGVQVDEGTIDYQRGQWEARAGLQYLPYGVYYSHFITDPMLLDLGETQAVAALVGYQLPGEVVARGYLYNGEVAQVNSAGEEYNDHLNGWGLGVEGMVTEQWGFAVGYHSNLADTGAELTETYHRRVGGWSAGLLVRWGAWEATLEGLGAAQAFAAEDLDGNADGEGDQPVAWNVELAWDVAETVEVAGRIEGTREYPGQPELQYGLTVSWAPWESVSASLEYLRAQYDVEFGDGADSRDLVTAQLATGF